MKSNDTPNGKASTMKPTTIISITDQQGEAVSHEVFRGTDPVNVLDTLLGDYAAQEFVFQGGDNAGWAYGAFFAGTTMVAQFELIPQP